MDVVHAAQRVWVGCMTSQEVQGKQELRPLSGQLWERCRGSAQPLSSQGALSALWPLFFPEGELQGGGPAVPEAARPSGGPVDGQRRERMQPGRELFALLLTL